MSGYVFLSAHDDSVTGGNKRFERLAKYGVLRKEAFWFTIERHDLDFKNDRLVHLKALPLPTYSIRFLVSCFLNRRLIKEKAGVGRTVIVFGETPMLGALFLTRYCKWKLSLGVRSNVPKRHQLMLRKCKAVKRIVKKIRYKMSDIVLRFAFNSSSSIVVQSPTAKLEFCGNYPVSEAKVKVIVNDLPDFGLRFKSQVQSRTYRSAPERVLFVGNGSEIKGFDIFMGFIDELKCCPVLKEVTVVGVDAADCFDDDRVLFLGRSSNVVELMLEHDLLIVPSREDQFPNVVLEALAVGLPVIGSRVDGISYMLEKDICLFEPGSVRALVDCYIRLTEAESYARLIEHVVGRRVDFVFDWEEEYFSII